MAREQELTAAGDGVSDDAAASGMAAGGAVSGGMSAGGSTGTSFPRSSGGRRSDDDGESRNSPPSLHADGGGGAWNSPTWAQAVAKAANEAHTHTRTYIRSWVGNQCNTSVRQPQPQFTTCFAWDRAVAAQNASSLLRSLLETSKLGRARACTFTSNPSA